MVAVEKKTEKSTKSKTLLRPFSTACRSLFWKLLLSFLVTQIDWRELVWGGVMRTVKKSVTLNAIIPDPGLPSLSALVVNPDKIKHILRYGRFFAVESSPVKSLGSQTLSCSPAAL